MKESQSCDLSLDERGTHFASLLAKTCITKRPELSHAATLIELESGLVTIVDKLLALRARNGGIYIIGNGGSAAVAAHIANDFVNMAKLRAITLHEPAVLTCMANDYGYENAYARLIATMAKAGDMVIGISSSGASVNIRSAIETARQAGAETVTLSGFAADNPLRSLGEMNFWIDANDYGLVEIGHLFILHNLADRIRINAHTV